MQVPWKARDLADNFIVFRRRLGRTEEYIEDLRVRRNFVRRILDLLMEPGFYRPDQGEQCRHMYYSTCDRVESNTDELPDDGVPSDLHFRDIDEQLPSGRVTKQMFVDWLSLGRHDCDVARSLGYAWTENLKGSDEETLGELFDRLVIDRAEEEAKEKEDCDDEKNDEDEEDTDVMDLTVPWLSKLFMEMFDMEKVPFHLEGESNEALLTALSEKMLRRFSRWKDT